MMHARKHPMVIRDMLEAHGIPEEKFHDPEKARKPFIEIITFSGVPCRLSAGLRLFSVMRPYCR